jgi:hypothetical protein
MEEKITLQFGYTFSDWIHALRFYDSKRMRSKIDKLFAIIVFAIACFKLWLNYDHSIQQFVFYDFGDFFITAFLFVASIAIWFDLATVLGTWSSYKKRVKGTPKQYTIIFDTDGAEFHLTEPTEQMHVRLAWAEFKMLYENQKTFLLILNKGDYWAIPKRYFTGTDQIDSFRRLVKQKLPHNP